MEEGRVNGISAAAAAAATSTSTSAAASTSELTATARCLPAITTRSASGGVVSRFIMEAKVIVQYTQSP